MLVSQHSPVQHFLSCHVGAGSQASPQDRFLIMAAEMENAGSQELALFWKEVNKAKVMEHRSVKSLHVLAVALGLLGCDIASCWAGSLPQVTLSRPGRCQIHNESAQGRSRGDGGRRTAGAEHGGEFCWKENIHPFIHSSLHPFIPSHQLMRVVACNSRLEQKLNTCLWVQKVLTLLVLVLLMLNLLCLYLLGTSAQPS